MDGCMQTMTIPRFVGRAPRGEDGSENMMVRILVLLLLHCVSALKMPLRPATAQVISRRGFLMATAPLFALGTQAQEARASCMCSPPRPLMCWNGRHTTRFLL